MTKINVKSWHFAEVFALLGGIAEQYMQVSEKVVLQLFANNWLILSWY